MSVGCRWLWAAVLGSETGRVAKGLAAWEALPGRAPGAPCLSFENHYYFYFNLFAIKAPVFAKGVGIIPTEVSQSPSGRGDPASHCDSVFSTFEAAVRVEGLGNHAYPHARLCCGHWDVFLPGVFRQHPGALPCCLHNIWEQSTLPGFICFSSKRKRHASQPVWLLDSCSDPGMAPGQSGARGLLCLYLHHVLAL